LQRGGERGGSHKSLLEIVGGNRDWWWGAHNYSVVTKERVERRVRGRGEGVGGGDRVARKLNEGILRKG